MDSLSHVGRCAAFAAANDPRFADARPIGADLDDGVAGDLQTQAGQRLRQFDAYRPHADETITLLTCNRPISGTFKTVNGAPLGKGDTFVLNYNAEPCKFTLVSGANSVAAKFIARLGTLVLVR